MTVDPSVVPGLLFLLAELVAIAGIGYVIVRVALRETDHRVALAQGLVVGPAIWGVVVNLVMYMLPGIPGAITGWIFVLSLAATLVWRAPKPVRPRLRTAGLFALAALALFWIALASRQMLTTPDAPIHIGLAASIRAGLFPPEIPWNPGVRVPYHYGLYLLSGLLAPPSGPDLAFAEELLGAYVWISLFLIVAAALLRRASRFTMLIIVPLLLTPGGWTLMFIEPFSILKIPVPTEIPAAGLRASLQDIYWPYLSLPLNWLYDMPPNIWTPSFTLSYALAFVVLERAARAKRRSWPAILTLAALIGFLGLTSSVLAPIVFVLWIGLEAVWLVQSKRAGTAELGDLIRSSSGVVLAGLLLFAGSLSTVLLGESTSSSLLLEWNGPLLDRLRLLGTLDRLPGGVGVLGLGPLAVAVVALLLAWRDRLVQALAAGAGLLLLASLLLVYEPSPDDLSRIEGHARNFALLALLVAFSIRFVRLRGTRWRYAAGAAFVLLVTWPTAAVPVRNVGLAIGSGVELTNPQRSERPRSSFGGRLRLKSPPSDHIAAYIRHHTAVDARVFSPNPEQMTYATGRPNASGIASLVHLYPLEGPQFRDVLSYLEPSAVRRLGFEYVHAPDSWKESLPEEAVSWLNDPNLFELLIRDESESLYRVLPAFLSLDAPPALGSYESLRRSVPSSATVFLPEFFQSIGVFRTARTVSHARQLGVIDPAIIHLRTPWRTESVGGRAPEFVIAPMQFVPWMFPAALRQPIWWNDETAVYALNGAAIPIMPSPPTQPFPFNIQLTDVSEADGRIAFTVTFDDRAPEQWTSQDWVLIATEAQPWGLPQQFHPNGTPVIAAWFRSYLNPGQGTTSLTHEFDFHAHSLAVEREYGVFKPVERSEGVLDEGTYVLAVRLRHEYKPNQWRDAAMIAVLRITVSETGQVSYQVYEDVRA